MTQPFVIQRRLDAPRQLMWEVLTQPQHLPHWLGPKGSRMAHSTLDFREGGSFLYCLHMPGGMQMWGQWNLREIEPPHRLALVQNFSDALGGTTRHPLSPTWPLQTWSVTTLEADGDQTLITIHWEPWQASAEETATFEAGFEGMQQGWSGNLDVLQAYLAQLQSKT